MEVDWLDLLSLDNLKSAYYQARNNFFRESFIDENQILLFERDLDNHLLNMQKRLKQLDPTVLNAEDIVHYFFPKSQNSTRLRASQRIEEETLSVALVRYLNNLNPDLLQKSSYAYRFKSQEDENLYQSNILAYNRFLTDARVAAEQIPNCVVIRTDVSSYYNNIVQSRLIELIKDEFTQEDRIIWLVQLLLIKDTQEHNPNFGLVQGSIGSGFYANIYLQQIDNLFTVGNKWGIKYYRFVDDMIFIVPNPSDSQEIIETLDKELRSINLSINLDKTVSLTVSDFLELTAPNEELESLYREYNLIINQLWKLPTAIKQVFQQSFYEDDEWWENIETYKNHLRSIGIFEDKPNISRRLTHNLFNNEENIDLNFPEFGVKPIEWGEYFKQKNLQWFEQKEKIKEDLINLFKRSWETLSSAREDGADLKQERRLQTQIRFATNRLETLGLETIFEELGDILTGSPWDLNSPASTLESLANQGLDDHISVLLNLHSNNVHPMDEYMRTIALKALRYTQNIGSHIQNLIVEFSTQSYRIDKNFSLPESIMATETWLHIFDQFHDNPKIDSSSTLDEDYLSEAIYNHIQKRVEAIITAQENPQRPLNGRLESNYLLLLGKYQHESLGEVEVDLTDPIQNIALELTKEYRSISSLPPEPQELRLRYYTKPYEKQEDEIKDLPSSVEFLYY